MYLAVKQNKSKHLIMNQIQTHILI